jgi:dephospho-CoA kinase
MSFIIGLTGGIASGKSTVAKMLRELNIPVVDADEEARLAVEKGEKAYYDIVSFFGEDILLSDGSIDRAKLGGIIFPNPEKRAVLNSIVHPAIKERMLTKQKQYTEAGNEVIVLDIPLLFEGKNNYEIDKIIVVYVDEQTQLERLMSRNQFRKNEALSRINSQMPLSQKRDLADAVIDNNGTIEETEKQLHDILKNWGF